MAKKNSSSQETTVRVDMSSVPQVKPKADLTKCKKVLCGLLKFWYSEREDGVLELVAFQVLYKRLTFYVPRGSVITATEEGDTVRIKVE